MEVLRHILHFLFVRCPILTFVGVLGLCMGFMVWIVVTALHAWTNDLHTALRELVWHTAMREILREAGRAVLWYMLPRRFRIIGTPHTTLEDARDALIYAPEPELTSDYVGLLTALASAMVIFVSRCLRRAPAQL